MIYTFLMLKLDAMYWTDIGISLKKIADELV